MLFGVNADDFIARHRLPDKFRTLIEEHYAPLVAWLEAQRVADRSLLLGINGAQGTGKTTLADYLKLALEGGPGWRVAVLSIDDFYLSKAERNQLGENVHPLLRTRGVPGTHDLHMLTACLHQLDTLGADQRMPLPRFDKATDDRARRETWPIVTGPLDLIILEGWCVASRPQPAADLETPVNELERQQDPTGDWRRYVNEQLQHDYADLFARLDKLIVLQAPDFAAVRRWRLEQEEKGARAMSTAQLDVFIQHYERLTRVNLESLSNIADAVLEFDDNHDCVRSYFAD